MKPKQQSTLSWRLFSCVAVVSAATAVACAALPAIPVVVDPQHPEVNGVEITQEEFLSRYCRGQSDSNTCISVVEAFAASAASSSRIPR